MGCGVQRTCSGLRLSNDCACAGGLHEGHVDTGEMMMNLQGVGLQGMVREH